MKKLCFLTILIFSCLVLASCSKDYALVEAERAKSRVPIWMSTNVTVMGTRGTRAGDNFVTTSNYEDKIVTLRLIISESGSGKIVKNIFYNNPTDLEKALIQNGPQWTKPFQITPGQYDFWFIANEGSNWYAPTDGNHDHANDLGNQVWNKLTAGSSIARIFDGKVFTGGDAAHAPLSQLDIAPYKRGEHRNRAWQPSEDRPMPMSAVYRNITVALTDAQGRGAHEDNPQHFIGNGHDVVQLMRCLAKVTIKIPHSGKVETFSADGRNYSGFRTLSFPFSGKFNVVLNNRARYWSFFNTPLFEMNHKPREFRYYKDIFPYPHGQSHYPYLRLKDWASNAAADKTEVFLTTPGSPLPPLSRDDADLQDYEYSFYMPEVLLEQQAFDGELTGKIFPNEPWDDRFFVCFAPEGTKYYLKDQWNLYNETPREGSYWPFSSKEDWKAKVEETTYFRVGHSEWPERADGTGNPLLPYPQKYSKFSILRNRHYMFTVRERDRLQVDVRIADWDEVPAIGETVMLDEVQLKIDDPTFSDSHKQIRLRLQNNFANHKWKYVVISLLDQNGINQSTAYGTPAYFENFGDMINASPLGTDRSKALRLAYGVTSLWPLTPNPAHHQAQAFIDFTLNWGNATGRYIPAADKPLIRFEFYDENNKPTTFIIKAKGSDWNNTYHAVEGNSDF